MYAGGRGGGDVAVKLDIFRQMYLSAFLLPYAVMQPVLILGILDGKFDATLLEYN